VKPFWLPEIPKQQNQKIIIIQLSVFVLTLPGLTTLKGQIPLKTRQRPPASGLSAI